MLSALMLNVVMLSVVMPNVVANALAYCEKLQLPAEKSFITLAPDDGERHQVDQLHTEPANLRIQREKM